LSALDRKAMVAAKPEHSLWVGEMSEEGVSEKGPRNI
jgi:hypothetical protein